MSTVVPGFTVRLPKSFHWSSVMSRNKPAYRVTPSSYSVIIPESKLSPGLALARKINGSLTSRLSVPVVRNTPFTVKSPTQVMSPPTLRLPIMPVPPATCNAPEATLVLCVVFVTLTMPLVLILPVTPTPPETVSAPVTLLVDIELLLKLTRSVPATVTAMSVAVGQYNPVLFAATEYSPGAPTVPDGNAVACSVSELRAPALNVTVMLLVPVAGAVVNNNVVF